MRPRHRRFVLEYLVDANGQQAAVRAGYHPRGARAMAHWLLNLPEVRHAVHDERAAQAARTGITAERVLAAYAAIAFADVTRIVRRVKGEGLRLRRHDALAPEDAAAIAELDGDGPRVRLFAKRPALAMLARYLALDGAPRRLRGLRRPGRGALARRRQVR